MLLSTDGEELESCPIQPNVELVRLVEKALDVISGVSHQADFDDVLAVEREMVSNRDSATRPEGKSFVHTVILHEVLGDIVAFSDRGGIRISNGQPRDLSCRRQVSLQQGRRYR